MGKKSKSDKSSKSTKSKSTKSKSSKPKANLPEFETGFSNFFFTNDDKYYGEYCAHRNGLVWREGQGSYITHDLQFYEGKWKDDRIDENEPLTILYGNHDLFSGKVQKFKYHGPGTYFFDTKGAYLSCNFEHNVPVGDVIYVDTQGIIWHGFAEPGKDQVLLQQEYVFSSELHPDRGKGRPKHSELPAGDLEQTGSKPSIPEYTLKELEDLVFHKSEKMPSHVDFEDSDWYREFLKFREMYRATVPKVAKFGVRALSLQELAWYKQYARSVKLLKKDRKPVKKHSIKRTDCGLLQTFYSPGFRDSCPPIRVFYPTEPEKVVKEEDEQSQPEKQDEPQNDGITVIK